MWIKVDSPYFKGTCNVVELVILSNTPFGDFIEGYYTRVDNPLKKEISALDKEDEKVKLWKHSRQPRKRR